MKQKRVRILLTVFWVCIIGCKSTHFPSEKVELSAPLKMPRIKYSLEKLDFQKDLVATESVWDEGVVVFHETFSNPEDQPIFIWISFEGGSFTVSTRITEHIHFGIMQPIDKNFWTISQSSFQIDQAVVTQNSAKGNSATDVISLSEGWMKFPVLAHEKIEIQWVAHAAASDHRCPLWPQHALKLLDNNSITLNLVEQSIVGAALNGSVNRKVRAAFAETPIDQIQVVKSLGVSVRPLVSTPEELHLVDGSSLPSGDDQPFGCDGLIQILPSSP